MQFMKFITMIKFYFIEFKLYTRSVHPPILHLVGLRKADTALSITTESPPPCIEVRITWDWELQPRQRDQEDHTQRTLGQVICTEQTQQDLLQVVPLQAHAKDALLIWPEVELGDNFRGGQPAKFRN